MTLATLHRLALSTDAATMVLAALGLVIRRTGQQCCELAAVACAGFLITTALFVATHAG